MGYARRSRATPDALATGGRRVLSRDAAVTSAAPPAESAHAATPGSLAWPAERFMGRASALEAGDVDLPAVGRVLVRRPADQLRRAARGVRRAGGRRVSRALGINFTAGLTFLLICSSVTMVHGGGRRPRGPAAPDRALSWRSPCWAVCCSCRPVPRILRHRQRRPAGAGPALRRLAPGHDLLRHHQLSRRPRADRGDRAAGDAGPHPAPGHSRPPTPSRARACSGTSWIWSGSWSSPSST